MRTDFIFKLLIFILLIGLVSAFTPQNDIDLINEYGILNVTNISAVKYNLNGTWINDSSDLATVDTYNTSAQMLEANKGIWVNKSDWTTNDNYPASCSGANEFVRAIGDTLTCVATNDTNTNANTICSGGTTYLDGDGNCDDISSVYEVQLNNEAGLYAALSDVSEFIETNDAATLTTLNTGNGANELYDMNQNVQTTDDVVFNTVNVTTTIYLPNNTKICWGGSGCQHYIVGNSTGIYMT